MNNAQVKPWANQTLFEALHACVGAKPNWDFNFQGLVSHNTELVCKMIFEKGGNMINTMWLTSHISALFITAETNVDSMFLPLRFFFLHNDQNYMHIDQETTMVQHNSRRYQLPHLIVSTRRKVHNSELYMPNQEMCKDMVHICSCPCDHLLEECLQSFVGSSVLYFLSPSP